MSLQEITDEALRLQCVKAAVEVVRGGGYGFEETIGLAEQLFQYVRRGPNGKTEPTS